MNDFASFFLQSFITLDSATSTICMHVYKADNMLLVNFFVQTADFLSRPPHLVHVNYVCGWGWKGGRRGDRRIGGGKSNYFSLFPSIFRPKSFFTHVLSAVGGRRCISVFVKLDLKRVERVHHLLYLTYFWHISSFAMSYTLFEE